MNHQPFEAQIIEHHSLDTPQQKAFNSHLVECGQCRNLFVKWQMVENQLQSTPMVAPFPGFRQRWQAGVSFRRAREQRRQVYRFLLILMGANLASIVVFISSVLWTGSAAQWLVSMSEIISNTLSFCSQIEEVIRAILQLFPPAVPVIIGALCACGLCMAIALWIFSLWRISFQGVVVK